MSSIVDLIEATVRIEQPIAAGRSTVGTGFVVQATAEDGSPRTILITANHVFATMPRDKASVGFRLRDEAGDWRYSPISVRIRDADGAPLWTRHPTQDVAAIELPAGVTNEGLPASELPGARALETLGVEPGDEMMVLGFPRGFSANKAGFPILRAGRVASFPLSPADRYPTYMLDFSVFGGNSGGPVYVVVNGPPGPAATVGPRVVVTGILTQQIKLDGDRLEIGNITQADFIEETMALMGAVEPAEVAASQSVLPQSDPEPAADPQPSAGERLKEAWHALITDIGVLARRAWIVLRDAFLSWTTPAPKRL